MKFNMAFDIFCPTKSSKSSRKASSLHQNTNRQNEAVQQMDNTSNHNVSNSNHANSISRSNNQNSNKNISLNPVPCMMLQVREDFNATEKDEIDAKVGEIVLCSRAADSDWIYVVNTATNQQGYVPTHILSEPMTSEVPKKKLNRSMTEHPMIDHNHHHHHHHHPQLGNPHSYRTHCPSEITCHSHGGSIRFIQNHNLRIDHNPQFDLSVQGSSGCQTFQKLSEFSQASHPSYYNLESQAQFNQHHKFQPFNRRDPREAERFIVLHNFVAREERDLEVKQCDYVRVLNTEDKNWFWVQREYDRCEGFVPASFIRSEHVIEAARAVMQKGNSTVTMKSSYRHGDHTYINNQQVNS